GHFSELAPAEQLALVEEVHREMTVAEDKVYKAFEWEFGKVMDEQLSKETRKRIAAMDPDPPVPEAAALRLTLELASDGCVSLLQKLPLHHRASIRLMLNQPIPSRSRRRLWKHLLSHSKARQGYMKQW
ncbi:unnamed protein product, partial [Chrysoparadoxa australica]